MENQQTTNQDLWASENNWNGFLYYCKEDDRFLVPKKNKYLGWTVNMGHSYAPWTLLITLIALPTVAALAGSRFHK